MISPDNYSLTILGQDFEIQHVPNLIVDGEKCEGGCYCSERVIKIDDVLRFDVERYNRVLTHELMHMAMGISGISEMMELKVEEAICVLMESVITRGNWDDDNWKCMLITLIGVLAVMFYCTTMLPS